MVKELKLNEMKSIIYDVVVLGESLEDIIVNNYNVVADSEEYQAYHDQLHEYITNVM